MTNNETRRAAPASATALSAVILAGGESRRMGQDKAWVTFQGKTLIQIAIEKVRTLGVAETFISGHPGEDYSSLNCQVLLDLEPDSGPLGGVERGLRECVAPLLLVIAVDLPYMRVDYLQRLATRCSPLAGVVPELNGHLEPLAAIYPKRCHPFALKALASPHRAARDFATACLRERAVRTLLVSASEAPYFTNCNRPADLDLSLSAAQARSSRSSGRYC